VKKLSADELSAFLSANPNWKLDGNVLSKLFTFPSYAEAVSFAVCVAVAAEKRDHHPDIVLTWGKVEVRWSTHDAGGVTALDTEMAAKTDSFHRTSPS
jgi:4a-hydroxytetrahydrobiopterin dehydratase